MDLSQFPKRKGGYIQMKKLFIVFSILFLLFALSGMGSTQISITDDRGIVFQFEHPVQRIVSLYTAHTENLYYLGAEEQIIGISGSEDYPPSVNKKTVCDYRSDPEKIIALNPDVVLIRDFILERYPRFVETLEKIGIPVINLNPEDWNDLEPYLVKLGIITGREESARQLIQDLNSEAKRFTIDSDDRPRVFFEAISDKFSTTTPGSIVDQLITMAGGLNIASDAVATSPDSRIADYGIERLLSKAKDIDIYIAQTGRMNRVSVPSIYERPGFNNIRAVQNRQVFVVNESIVSRPTPRLLWGLEELFKIFHLNKIISSEKYTNLHQISRKDFVTLMVQINGIQLYVPTLKDFQNKKHYFYGNCVDLQWTDPASRYVETLIHLGIIDPEMKEENYYFYPDKPITRKEAAFWLYCLLDFEHLKKDRILPSDISHLDRPYQTAIKITYQAGIFDGILSDDTFLPDQTLTGKEALHILEQSQQAGKRIHPWD
jgi:iron complex transport system substrate-binding protein